MLNIDHQQSSFCQSTTMVPRISFSNDFADAAKIQNSTTNYKEAPVSGDFEFSVTNLNSFSSLSNDHSSADEIFFMGKLLPLKERKTTTMMTLRDELLVSDVDLIPQVPKGFSKWKDRFSLTRRGSNEMMKKSERRDGCLESVAEKKTATLIFKNDHLHTMKKLTEVNKHGNL